MSEANEIAPRVDGTSAGRTAPSATVAAALAHRAHDGPVAVDWALVLRWLQRIARTSCRSADDWDEVSQEAAVRAWQVLRGGASERGLEGLLVKKVQEAAVDAARKRRRRARREQAATDAGLVLQGDDVHPLANDRPDESAMASLLEQVVVPAFTGLARADVDLWVAAKLDGYGWQAAGKIMGLERPAIRQARQRILRFLSTEGRVRRLTGWMDDAP